MAKVELKQPIVQEIAGSVEGASSVLLVQYLGLTVDQDTKMRKELREAGVDYKVYKNTMMNLALKDTQYSELTKHLEGPNALAVSKEDPIAGARILAKYVKQYDCLKFVAGVVDGSYLDEAGIAEIASIPSREVLLGRLLGSMQSPVANFARVLQQIADKGPVAEETPAEEAKAEEAPAEEAKTEEAPAEEAKTEETAE